jgi:hypothetical protein
MNANLAPFRPRRSSWPRPDLVKCAAVAQRAKAIASQTMREVKEAVGLP